MHLIHFIHMKPLCPPLPIPAWELLPKAVGRTAEGLGECRGPGGLRRARGSWRRWSRKHTDQETRTQTEKARGVGVDVSLNKMFRNMEKDKVRKNLKVLNRRCWYQLMVL